MNIAIIPARGGSKRIPRKNIKEFHGKPMIAYSIEAAKKSGCFDEIIVSTDDQEIADIAIKYGAEVPFLRPAKIADDHATTIDVMQHAIDWCCNHNLNATHYCCIYATAPFIKPNRLIEGGEIINNNAYDYVFSATSFAFPIQRALKLNELGSLSMFNPEHFNSRSQDLEEAYHDAGQFYWGTKSAFMTGKPFFSSNSQMVQLPRKEVQDIDTAEDWEYAERLYKLMNP